MLIQNCKQTEVLIAANDTKMETETPWGNADATTLNEIPRDLFPKAHKHLTKEWCRRTYKYFHCFDSSVRSKVYDNDEDLTKWESCAMLLIDEIKDKGFLEAKNEIVRVAKKRFNLKTIDNKEIVNWEDVVNLFKSTEWYNEDVDHKRYILYMFQYGIFRNTSNTWMHEAAYDWMYAYKVTYKALANTKPKGKTRKGFLHELLHLKASNTIQDRFMKTCKRYLGQHLLCRDRIPITKKVTSTEYQELTFLNYTAYLVIDMDHKNNINTASQDPKKRVLNSITYAIEHGMTKNDIIRICESFFGSNGKYLHFLFVMQYISLTCICFLC